MSDQSRRTGHTLEPPRVAKEFVGVVVRFLTQRQPTPLREEHVETSVEIEVHECRSAADGLLNAVLAPHVVEAGKVDPRVGRAVGKNKRPARDRGLRSCRVLDPTGGNRWWLYGSWLRDRSGSRIH